MKYVIYCTMRDDVTRWVKCGESATKQDAKAYARQLKMSGHNDVTIDPVQGPIGMDYLQLMRELSSRGFSLREMRPAIDESFPTAKWIINSNGRKWGFAQRIEVATFLLKVRQGAAL